MRLSWSSYMISVFTFTYSDTSARDTRIYCYKLQALTHDEIYLSSHECPRLLHAGRAQATMLIQHRPVGEDSGQFKEDDSKNCGLEKKCPSSKDAKARKELLQSDVHSRNDLRCAARCIKLVKHSRRCWRQCSAYAMTTG